MGWVVNATPRPLYPREDDPVPIVYEAGWTPGPVWTGAEYLAPAGIRSLDRAAVRGGAVVRGLALQVGRSWVRFPMV